jgi:hypothetical protein
MKTKKYMPRMGINTFALCFLFLSCTGTSQTMINENPILIRYITPGAFIDLDASMEAKVERTDYKNIENGIVENGDSEPGWERSERYLFSNKRIKEIIIERRKDSSVVVEAKISFEYRDSKIFISNNNDGQNNYIYTVNKKEISSNDEKGSEYFGSKILINDSSIQCWKTAKSYTKRPEKPDVYVVFNKTETVYTNTKLNGDAFSSWVYQAGILMRTEYAGTKKIKYSVNNGEGVVFVEDGKGNVIEKWDLLRKLNEKGFLVYEKVKYPDGRGYELKITYGK